MQRLLSLLFPALLAAGLGACATRPDSHGLLFRDADPLSLSVSVRSPSDKPAERGLMSIAVFHRMIPREPEGLWSNGQQATASVVIPKADLVAWARSIASLQLPGQYATTFCIHSFGERGAQPAGVPVEEYLESHAQAAGLHFRTVTSVDGWGRSRWLFVPWENCSSTTFARLHDTCNGEELKRLVRLLGKHYDSNRVQPADGTGAASE